MNNKSLKQKNAFLQPDQLIQIFLVILFIERMLVFLQLGPDYNSGSDDINYVQSGITFAKTGMISYGGAYPSALIMPGMTVTVGLFCLAFGEGAGLWIALRVFWSILGVMTAWAAYRTAKLLSNGWGGLGAAIWFALPNMAWMNHVVLTETPYILFSTLCLLYTFLMGKDSNRRWFFCYTASFFFALMFRANAILLPLFTGGYLIWKRAFQIRRAISFALLLLLFFIPWTIRNYLQFGAFVPLTYGSGQPMLQGTYQGEGWPEDSVLDYETNVHRVMLRDYAGYYLGNPTQETDRDPYLVQYDPEGEVKEARHVQYLFMQKDGIKAKYRLTEWRKADWKSLLKSYLYIKPRWMLNWSWAWEEVFHVPYQVLHRISQINLIFCLFAFILCIILKKPSGIPFLCIVYFVQVYIYSLSFVTDRYASSLMVIRYIWAGVGVGLMTDLACTLQRKKKEKTNIIDIIE